MIGLHPETAPAAQLHDMARFAPSPSITWLREQAEAIGLKGLDDDDFTYAEMLLACGHQLPVVLERLLSLAADAWVSAGEPVERWRCRNCGGLHESHLDAHDCCPPEAVYLCGRCEKEHWTESSARECCAQRRPA